MVKIRELSGPGKIQWCKQDFFPQDQDQVFESQDQGKTKTSKIFPSQDQDQDFFQDQDQDFVTSLDSHHS